LYKANKRAMIRLTQVKGKPTRAVTS